MIRCSLCGEFYDVGRVFVSVQTVACDQCVSKLLDDETDRRARHSRAIERMRQMSGQVVTRGE